ncbi:hypothetical protein M0804_007536 [Polistes exclamans]|nr:hypothetical protein M0804_007536 [Polistes exclamans]
MRYQTERCIPTIEWNYECPETMVDPLSIERKTRIGLSNNTRTTTTRISGNNFSCPRCNRSYKVKRSLRRHLIVECGKAPMFSCPYCVHRSKYRASMAKHVRHVHPNYSYP